MDMDQRGRGHRIVTHFTAEHFRCIHFIDHQIYYDATDKVARAPGLPPITARLDVKCPHSPYRGSMLCNDNCVCRNYLRQPCADCIMTVSVWVYAPGPSLPRSWAESWAWLDVQLCAQHECPVCTEPTSCVCPKPPNLLCMCHPQAILGRLSLPPVSLAAASALPIMPIPSHQRGQLPRTTYIGTGVHYTQQDVLYRPPMPPQPSTPGYGSLHTPQPGPRPSRPPQPTASLSNPSRLRPASSSDVRYYDQDGNVVLEPSVPRRQTTTYFANTGSDALRRLGDYARNKISRKK